MASLTGGTFTRATRAMRHTRRSWCYQKLRTRTGRPTWQGLRGACVALRVWHCPCSLACLWALRSGTLAAIRSVPTERRPWHRRGRPDHPRHPRLPRLPLHFPHTRPRRRRPRRRRPVRRIPTHRHRHQCCLDLFTRRRSNTRSLRPTMAARQRAPQQADDWPTTTQPQWKASFGRPCLHCHFFPFTFTRCT